MTTEFTIGQRVQVHAPVSREPLTAGIIREVRGGALVVALDHDYTVIAQVEDVAPLEFELRRIEPLTPKQASLVDDLIDAIAAEHDARLRAERERDELVMHAKLYIANTWYNYDGFENTEDAGFYRTAKAWVNLENAIERIKAGAS